MKARSIVPSAMLFTILLAAVRTHAEKWVKFECKPENLQLEGILTRPKGDGPFPAIVMLCGCGGLKKKEDAEQQRAWADRLATWGYVSLRVDSYGPRGYENICDKTMVVSNINRMHDAYSAKSYLATLGFVDAAKIGVIGWSHGGWAVMTLVEGMYRYEEPTPFRAAVAFYPWCERLYAFDTPLLILTGGKDDWCPASRCEILQDLEDVKDSEFEFRLKIYPDAYHAFDFVGLNEDSNGHHAEYNPEAAADAIEQTKEFLAKYLK